MIKKFICVFICCLLTACDDEATTYAPVTDLSTIEPIPKSGIHQVKQNETLYEIAWRYGLDYRSVVKNNEMKTDHVQPGQTIHLHPEPPSLAFNEELPHTTFWTWPAKGDIIGPYSSLNKGVNIAGSLGEPIYAASNGQVVYCGSGLRGYGNLIIIKHDSEYLSAYAHTSTIQVSEGEQVKQGQKIAEMGNTGTDRVMLHFEIRRAGKPIDPVSFIMK